MSMAQDKRKRISFGRPSKGRARKTDGSPNWAGRPPRGLRLKKIGVK
jgi:hypothetical protein